MQNSKKNIPMLPGFYRRPLGRKPRSPQQVFAEKIALLRQKSFKQIGELFTSFIPRDPLKPEPSGKMSRQRLFTKENTFWAFFSQVLDADGGCKEVIRKFQSYASLKGIEVPSSSTASYCTARKKLEEQTLTDILAHTTRQIKEQENLGILNNRRVIVVDGTGVSMPDTPENQATWPQSKAQKPGCGFPTARICACFSLTSGALLSYALGNKKSNELPLFRQQWNTFQPGDIFLADKGFCSYFDIAMLQKQGVDSLVSVARRKPVKAAQSLKKFGANDLLITWKRPCYNAKLSYSKETWKELPEELVFRQIKILVNHPGFRKKSFYIVTTLLDPVAYPAEEIAELYFRRWDVELFFRDIKITMGMDILRCLTPEMIRKELLMHFIAYNCVRQLMCESALQAEIPVRLVSFKGCMQAIRTWEPHLYHTIENIAHRTKLMNALYEAITNTPIVQRPERSEPRCVKRRPKNYQLMTKPRAEMKELPHRGRCSKKRA